MMAFTAEHAQQWRALLDARSERLAAKGAAYLHLIVPDKGSLDAEGPLRRFASMQGGLPLALLDVGPALLRYRRHHPLFWKDGEVWTPWACHEAYRLLCARLGVARNPQLLGYGFDDDVRADETIRRYRFAWRSRRHHANSLVTVRDELGRQDDRRLDEGSHAVFRNDHPGAFPRCVMLFGDACSDIDPHLLTGMLAETFCDVHFVWNESIDDELIERVRPDIVITQGIEQRMGIVPEDGVPVASVAARSMTELGKEHVSETVAPDVVRHTLLPSETYHLDPPITVQADCHSDVNDTVMHSNPVTLLDVRDADVYFTGGSWSVSDAGGTGIESCNVDPARARPGILKRRRKLPGLSLLFATSAGAHCYYHWMLEILPKLGLLEREGIRLSDIDHVLVREITGEWQLETLARLGIDRSRVVETLKQPYLRCERVLHVELACGINLKMPRFVPMWMRHLYPLDATDESRLRLYIGRPEGVRRGVSNEADMRPLLEAAGIESVVMEGRSVREQAMLLARADVVVAPHGGALTNTVFCRPGTRIVELLSRHVYPYYFGLAASCGHVYHAVLEDPAADYPRLVSHRIAQSHAADEIQHATSGRAFDVPLDALERVLRLV